MEAYVTIKETGKEYRCTRMAFADRFVEIERMRDDPGRKEFSFEEVDAVIDGRAVDLAGGELG